MMWSNVVSEVDVLRVGSVMIETAPLLSLLGGMNSPPANFNKVFDE